MKSVRQIFEWSTIDGRPIIDIDDWIASLSETEQQQYRQARYRQDVYRQQAIDAGLMRWEPNGDYVWRDQDAATQGKGCDKDWLTFFQRWQQECGIILNIKFIED